MLKLKSKSAPRDLCDRDFYEQACSYFYYHAEQRTTMINYFIAVFGACIALYGSLIAKYPFASVLISVFLCLISVLFCSMDVRNRFDVKQSQSVIAQIEKDYQKNRLQGDAQAVYGVFSNEDNLFCYYGLEKRLSKDHKEYRKFRRIQKRIKLLEFFKLHKKAETLQTKFNHMVKNYLGDANLISYDEFVESMNHPGIMSLSRSIKWMYYLCITMSACGVVFALYMAGIIDLSKLLG